MSAILQILSIALLLLSSHSVAHTWNEQFALIDSDGKYTGPMGYSRGYVGRTDPGFNGYSMLHLLPPLESGRTRIDSSDLLCHPAQRHFNQTSNYPRLKVAPGSAVAMKYLENGHVTLPLNQPGKPPRAGTAFVYGTTSPHVDERIATVLEWTRDGKGGDGRGRLLAAENFDDGRCHQINSSPLSIARQQTDPDPVPGQPGTVTEQWCETDLILPSDLAVGKLLTIYWIWQWPTAPGSPGLPDGKDEYYTTCSDFDVVAHAPDGPVINTLSIQDPQTAAVQDYKSRPVISPTPVLKFDPIGPNADRKLALESSMSPPAPVPSPAAASLPAPGAYSIPSTSGNNPAPTPAAPSSFAYSAYPTMPPSAPATSLATQTQTLAVTNPSSVVLTALVTVVATLAPDQSMLVVQGNHIVTFSNPNPPGMAAPAPTPTPTPAPAMLAKRTQPDAVDTPKLRGRVQRYPAYAGAHRRRARGGV